MGQYGWVLIGGGVSGCWQAKHESRSHGIQACKPLSEQACKLDCSNGVSWWLAVKGFRASLRLRAVPDIELLK